MIEIFDKLFQSNRDVSIEKEKHQLFERDVYFVTRLQ